MLYVITSTFLLSFSYLTSLKGIRCRHLAYIIISLISLFFIFNRQNNDYLAYLAIFTNPNSHAEPGYAALVDLLKSLGLNHHKYVLLVLGLFFSVTFFRFVKYTPYAAFIVSLYFIFPLSSDITQVRNAFSLLFFLNSLIFYAQDKKIISYSLLFAGITFHYIGLIYVIVFIALELNMHKKSKKLFLILMSIFAVFSAFLIPYLLKISLSLFKIRTLHAYIVEEEKISSLFIWGLPILSDVLIFYILIKGVRHKIPQDNIQLIDTIYAIIAFSLILLPSTIFLFEINRYFRTVFILKYVLTGLIFSYISAPKKTALMTYMIFSSSLFGSYYHFQLDNDYIFYGT